MIDQGHPQTVDDPSDEAIAHQVKSLLSAGSATVALYLSTDHLAIACEQFPDVEERLRSRAEWHPLLRELWELVSAHIAARAAARAIQQIASGNGNGILPLTATIELSMATESVG
ncbi:hypothetical protein [Piscinibacter sakaiensis]|uniref:hypothetical protein n=1 Tax=Piscinibacter sakaiensis TaxID=1547922 RepID=UPI003AAC5D1A